MALPMDRFLNLTYFFAIENAEEEERDKFDRRLNMPDARARRTGAATNRPDSPWTRENEQAALSGLVAALSGGR